MAGTLVLTEHQKLGHVRKLTFTGTADASDGSFPTLELVPKIEGRLLDLATNPGATGPTSLYDVTLIDEHGHDVLETVGEDRSITATEKVPVLYSGTGTHPTVDISDTLTLTIANNSVNSAVTVIILYYGMI